MERVRTSGRGGGRIEGSNKIEWTEIRPSNLEPHAFSRSQLPHSFLFFAPELCLLSYSSFSYRFICFTIENQRNNHSQSTSKLLSDGWNPTKRTDSYHIILLFFLERNWQSESSCSWKRFLPPPKMPSHKEKLTNYHRLTLSNLFPFFLFGEKWWNDWVPFVPHMLCSCSLISPVFTWTLILVLGVSPYHMLPLVRQTYRGGSWAKTMANRHIIVLGTSV